MILSIDKVMKQINSFSPICLKDRDRVFPVSSVFFFNKSTDYSALDYLYLGYASQFTSDCAALQSPVLIICIEDIPLSDELLSLEGPCLVKLPGETDPFSVFNAIDALFHEDTLLKNYTEKLYEAMIQNQSIQDILDMAVTYLKNPVVLIDRSLKHIATSTDVELEDYVWLDQKKNGGYISDASFELLTKQMAYEKNSSDLEPVILPKGDFKYRRIIHHIFFNHQLAGTIILFEVHKEFEEMDMQFIKMLSDLVALKMKSDPSTIYSKTAAYEHFFLDLLNDKISPSNLYERIQTLNIVIQNHIFIITIDISEFDQTHRTIQYLKTNLEETLREGTTVIYNNYIVTVIMLEDRHLLPEKAANLFRQFCQKRGLSAGISKCFHDISKLRLYYEQALTAIDLNRRLKRTGPLAFYEDFIPEHLLDIASHHTDLKLLCCNDLINLDFHDKKNHTSYTSCLYEFLTHDKNLAHTAGILHIHRNTLIYRINKIKEILNHDLEDSGYCFQLLLSYKIISFLENRAASET
ncbi:MAG: hypothetical protein E7248_06760 [Paenibacillaceae bacterium]|nr:hypothetical protein [Paenibacillaceae bacterium]